MPYRLWASTVLCRWVCKLSPRPQPPSNIRCNGGSPRRNFAVTVGVAHVASVMHFAKFGLSGFVFDTRPPHYGSTGNYSVSRRVSNVASLSPHISLNVSLQLRNPCRPYMFIHLLVPSSCLVQNNFDFCVQLYCFTEEPLVYLFMVTFVTIILFGLTDMSYHTTGVLFVAPPTQSEGISHLLQYHPCSLLHNKSD